MTEPRATFETGAATSLAAAGRHIFPVRFALGLAALVVGALVIRPGRLFGSHQLPGTAFSFCLVVGGLGLRAWAGANAGIHTRSKTIEAPRLITCGPYAYVRNPIYLGSIVLGMGMVGLLGDPRLLPVSAGVFALLYFAIIPAEEQFLRTAFGGEYQAFCSNVPRLIPRLRPWPGSVRQAPANWRAARGDLRIGLLLVAIYGGMRVILHLRGGS